MTAQLRAAAEAVADAHDANGCLRDHLITGFGWQRLLSALHSALRAADDAGDADAGKQWKESPLQLDLGDFDFVLTGEVRVPLVGEWFLTSLSLEPCVCSRWHNIKERRVLLDRRPKVLTPPNTVAVEVAVLRKIYLFLIRESGGQRMAEKIDAAQEMLRAILPPEAARVEEPPKELVAKWKAEHSAWFTEECEERRVHRTRTYAGESEDAYVAGCRAYWQRRRAEFGGGT